MSDFDVSDVGKMEDDGFCTVHPKVPTRPTYTSMESVALDSARPQFHSVPEGTRAATEAVLAEFSRATRLFPERSNSAHEAYAVLAEEVDELWDEVKGKTGKRSVEDLRKEAVQVAAMALRFIVDVCSGPDPTT